VAVVVMAGVPAAAPAVAADVTVVASVPVPIVAVMAGVPAPAVATIVRETSLTLVLARSCGSTAARCV
jgi:hypothetical protein